ncbi:adenylate kinase [Bienertia sinuspersici]
MKGSVLELMSIRDQGLNDKTDEQIFQDVLGKDTHGYLRAYGPGKSITQHFKVKPSRLDLTQELIEVKKKADQLIEKQEKMLKMLEWKLKRPKKKQKPLGMMWIEKLNKTIQFGRRSSINL